MRATGAAEEIVIVGAGIAGLATALGLHRQGFRCLVLESSDTLRASGFSIALMSNGWRALDALGVADSLRVHHLQLQELIFSSAISGSVTAREDLTAKGKRGVRETRCVMRNKLLEALAKELPDGTVRFSSKLSAVAEAGSLKLLHLEDGSTIKAKVLIGCDGIHSVVANWMGLKKPACWGRYALRGLATVPGGHGLKPEFAFCFGRGFRLGMVPTDEKIVYWFYTWTSSADGEEFGADADGVEIKELLLRKLKSFRVPCEFVEVVERTEPGDVASAPLRFRSPIDLLRGDSSRGNVCVAGDAWHPMTPYAAQGGGAALEDGVVLARCLGEALAIAGGGDECGIERALRKYADERRRRSFDLAATSYALGWVQESDCWIGNVVRDEWLAGFLAKRMLRAADFDCGQL